MSSKTIPGKKVIQSRVQLAQLMQPSQANHHGNVHGGWIMKLVDEAGALYFENQFASGIW